MTVNHNVRRGWSAEGDLALAIGRGIAVTNWTAHIDERGFVLVATLERQRPTSERHSDIGQSFGGTLADEAGVPLTLTSRWQLGTVRGVVAPRCSNVTRRALPPTSRSRLMSAPGSQIADPERAFLEHLPTIERVIGVIVRRNALAPSDADDFASWVRARIVDSGYAIFRKFAGRSSMPTYLSVVLGNLFHDYRNSVWGRWRPSAAAVRMGPHGVRLEELVSRDGCSLREAVEVLRSAGAPLTEQELRKLALQLPMRLPTSEVPLDAIDGTPSEVYAARTDTMPDDDDFSLLRDAMASLPDEDRVIIRMRFWDDVSVADVARALGLEQKPLYRRIEAIESRLREQLAKNGLDRERALELLSSEAVW